MLVSSSRRAILLSPARGTWGAQGLTSSATRGVTQGSNSVLPTENAASLFSLPWLLMNLNIFTDARELCGFPLSQVACCCLLPIFLLGLLLPVPADLQDPCELSVTVLSNMVASNHTRRLSAESGWSGLGSEERKIHLEFRRLGVEVGKQNSH